MIKFLYSFLFLSISIMMTAGLEGCDSETPNNETSESNTSNQNGQKNPLNIDCASIDTDILEKKGFPVTDPNQALRSADLFYHAALDMPFPDMRQEWLSKLDDTVSLKKKFDKRPGLKDMVKRQDKAVAVAMYCALNEIVDRHKEDKTFKPFIKPCSEVGKNEVEYDKIFNCREELTRIFLALKSLE